jgi:dUTP pyrophosphatase
MNAVEVLVQRLDPGLPLPAYEHPGDAGMDLRSRIDVSIEPGGRCLVPTGIAVALRPGFAAFVHPRSGIAIRHGVTILNAPGTIDAGYRGEISVILVNHDPAASFSIARGDRIAQLVITSVEFAVMVEVSELPGSHRGDGGFGSTGGIIGTVVP